MPLTHWADIPTLGFVRDKYVCRFLKCLDLLHSYYMEPNSPFLMEHPSAVGYIPELEFSSNCGFNRHLGSHQWRVSFWLQKLLGMVEYFQNTGKYWNQLNNCPF